MTKPRQAKVWAIVVAGGAGTRFGRPKQFAPLAGRLVLDWSVEAARSVAEGVVVVLPPDQIGLSDSVQADLVVAGGVLRSDSVRAGLGALPDDADIVVVHDAARPLAGAFLFEAVVAAVVAGADAAIPGVVVSDTVKKIDDEWMVSATVDRTGLVLVQTPQAFGVELLRSAHANGADATDDAALVEEVGGSIRVVPGDPANLKITHPDDLIIAEALLEARAAKGHTIATHGRAS
jgi:2-C-methyl-D-erythritol 4-phosphate cytidylyltransferase